MKYCILDPMVEDRGVGGFLFSRPQVWGFALFQRTMGWGFEKYPLHLFWWFDHRSALIIWQIRKTYCAIDKEKRNACDTWFVFSNLEESKRAKKCCVDVFNEDGYEFYI